MGSNPTPSATEMYGSGRVEELVADGKIACYGVSNFDVAELNEVRAAAGPKRIAGSQVLYHLQERAIEHAVIPWCERHSLAVVAYSPFGSGDFPSPRSRGCRVLAEIAAERTSHALEKEKSKSPSRPFS